MERLTSLVSSRGILKSCSIHAKAPESSSPEIDPKLIVHHKAGGSIYICTEALGRFADEIAPRISEPFVLVTGDSDLSVSSEVVSNPKVAALLENSLLTAWHAQNLGTFHPKINPLPIGIDYHTMSSRAGFWSLGTASPIAQENALIDAFTNSLKLEERFAAVYCSWHFTMGSLDRIQCMERLDKSVCFFEQARVPRCATWQRQSQCMFVASPEGVGMDCHRTWEALALGCIPIIRRSPIAKLFESLPVIIVEDWAEVNRAMLLEHVSSAIYKQFNFSMLFREFWMRRIRGEFELEMPPMTFGELRVALRKNIG